MHDIRDGKVYDEETGKLLKTHVDDGITYDENDDVVTLKALSFKTFAELADEVPKDWLIEDVIALHEDSTWYGEDGVGKSTVADDIAVHVASGRDWRGHKFNHNVNCSDPADVNIEECRGVIIFATERAALHRRRLEAYKIRDNLPSDLPITVVHEMINLCDPGCVEIISDTIFEFERENKCSVGLVIIDSWSKALGGCDENLAATQNYACANLGKIRARYFLCQFHIMTIGHCGKAGKDERGSGAKRAHMDLAVHIDNGTAEVVKANDVPLGKLAAFEPEEFTVTRPAFKLGERDFSECSFTVSILAPYSPEAATPASAARTAVFEPTGKNGEALDALKRVLASHGQGGAVPLAHWKQELTRAELIKPGDTNNRATFKRIQKALCQHLIFDGDLVRLSKSQPGNPPPCPI
jgi:hypothetical protein